MLQDGDGEQTSLINLSVMASYETKGGGCSREVTVMGSTDVTRHLCVCKSKPGHFKFYNCLPFVQQINVLPRGYLNLPNETLYINETETMPLIFKTEQLTKQTK